MDIRLTSLAHGGGCGCKLSPGVLRELLVGLPASTRFADLLVGNETSDDAAVYRISDRQAVISTTDFFMPIVDDPYDFGRIAAANALSDVYAMGGRPIMALAILGMPLAKIANAVIARILEGGAAICAEAGVPVAGGHSIDAPEPIYGLAVTGLVDTVRLKRNDTARTGDTLILTKPLGIGVISAALRSDRLDAGEAKRLYGGLVRWTTKINAVGAALGEIDAVHAMTDVTGFGLLGHLLEMCRGSRLAASIAFDALPFITGVPDLARDGIRTGAASRNWDSYGEAVRIGKEGDWRRDLMCDPQTSGGLLIAVDGTAVSECMAILADAGFTDAAIIGHMTDGEPAVIVA